MIHELSKMKVDEFNLEYKEFNFRDELKEILEDSIVQALLKGLQFNIFIDQNIPKQIYSDPDKIIIVLFNLVANSIKYT